MRKFNITDAVASEMERIVNSTEHQEMFAAKPSLEKVAFKKVSEEDTVNEVEKEVEYSLNKKASTICKGCDDGLVKKAGAETHCSCDCKNVDACRNGCACHDKGAKPSNSVAGFADHLNPADDGIKLSSVIQSLVKISSVLENSGFERQSAATLMLAESLVSEAKAKKNSKDSKKSETKSDKKDSKKDSKKSKTPIKDRMEKMREMRDKKKKDSKKSDKKSDKK
jgi:hypothetical protein